MLLLLSGAQVDFVASHRSVRTSPLLKEYVRLNISSSFNSFSDHMKNNAIGPIITVQKFVRTRIPIGTATFMSSDSGSATRFRAFEDGYVYL